MYVEVLITQSHQTLE